MRAVDTAIRSNILVCVPELYEPENVEPYRRYTSCEMGALVVGGAIGMIGGEYAIHRHDKQAGAAVDRLNDIYAKESDLRQAASPPISKIPLLGPDRPYARTPGQLKAARQLKQLKQTEKALTGQAYAKTSPGEMLSHVGGGALLGALALAVMAHRYRHRAFIRREVSRLDDDEEFAERIEQWRGQDY